jgi:hypothetical protein
MYKCKDCDFTTKRKFNLQSHIERKNSCKHINLDNSENNITSKNSDLYCEKCNKDFSNIYNFRIHTKTCKGKTFECNVCKKAFLNHQSKYYHKNNVRCKPPPPPPPTNPLLLQQAPQTLNNNGNNSFGNQLTHCSDFDINNINNIENKQLFFYFFGKETITHLTKTNDMVYVMNGFARRGIYGLADMVRDIYLDKDNPHNHTIMKMVSRGSVVHVRDNESDILDMQYREFEDTRSSLLIVIGKCFELYNLKLIENNVIFPIGSEEKERMKKFIQFYLSIGGESQAFMTEEFDVCNDYVKSLDSEEISKNINKFDNASQDVIHKKTSSLFKNTITRMKKIVL